MLLLRNVSISNAVSIVVAAALSNIADASPSTRKVYNAGLNKYRKFCKMANRSISPVSEDTLLLFTAHLATEGTLASTIKVYLSAIRSSHVAAGRHDEFTKQLTPQAPASHQRDPETAGYHFSPMNSSPNHHRDFGRDTFNTNKTPTTIS